MTSNNLAINNFEYESDSRSGLNSTNGLLQTAHLTVIGLKSEDGDVVIYSGAR